MTPPETSHASGRATILDVAALAGVSRQTVTRAMNGMSGISAATKDRVLAAAEELNYRPSRFGRGLVMGGERQLGLIVNDLRNPYTPQLAAAVYERAAELGWNVLLADIGLAGDPEQIVTSLGAQADVVIGYLGHDRDRWIDLLGTVPVVELDPHPGSPRGAVRIDPAESIEDLADHLKDVGVRHPVVLDGSVPEQPSHRASLLLTALRQRGYVPLLVHANRPTSEHAATETMRLLSSGWAVDAILAFNDVIALGALQGCRRSGVDVPGQVRVVGIDGLPLGELVTPTLSTLSVDLDAVAQEAIDLALGMLTGTVPRSGPDAQRTVHNRLVLRESA